MEVYRQTSTTQITLSDVQWPLWPRVIEISVLLTPNFNVMALRAPSQAAIGMYLYGDYILLKWNKSKQTRTEEINTQ